MVRHFIQEILNGYTIDPNGIHGIPHWARVYEIGERLAAKTEADIELVHLFALFHDSRRVNDHIDPEHGKRGAELAASLRGSLIDLDDHRFDLLYYACEYHTDGMTDADITVQVCWDSDRLDLGRVGISPEPRYLCTDVARQERIIDWATIRAHTNAISPLVDEWFVD